MEGRRPHVAPPCAPPPFGVLPGEKHSSVARMKVVDSEDVIGDDPAADDVLRDDPLHHLRCDPVIPDPVGIDDGDRTLLAYAKTIDLGVQHRAGSRLGHWIGTGNVVP